MKNITVHSKKLCLLAIMLMACVFTAVAADFTEDNLNYNIIDDNTVEVAKWDSDKYSGEIVIPAAVVHDGVNYQVTRIGKSAFYSCRDLNFVEIPEGITEIANDAFSACGIQAVELPNSLVSIGDNAFSWSESITNVYIPRNVAVIGRFPFYDCTALTDIMCSSMNPHFKSVNGVLYSKDMTSLVAYPTAASSSSFDVPTTVTRIEMGAFAFNQSLTQINFPENLEWIGASAIRDCDNLVSLEFPDNVSYIGPACFCKCDNLVSVHLPATLDTICNSIAGDLRSLTELVIPRNVKYMDDFACAESDALKSIIFEEGSQLDAIGLRAFENTGLESFDMPNSVTRIDGQIFGYCYNLKRAHLSDNLREMDSSTFWDCTALTEGEIPGGVVSIKNAFVNCSSMKRLKIGDRNSAPGVTTIKNCGISRCYQVEYLELGANVDSLEYGAFSGIDSLKVLISWAAAPPRCDGYWSSFRPKPQDMDAVLYVPRASLEAYSTAPDWMNFNTIVAIEDVGDVDLDGSVEIADVTALIDQLLNGEILLPAIADVDFDGMVSISDVSALIDLLLTRD